MDKMKNLILVVPNQRYGESLIEFIKKVEKKYNKICYITLNETFKQLEKNFQENNIELDKFFFIDAISRVLKTQKQEFNKCIMVSSPNSLIELSLAVSKVIETQKPEVFILDSVSTLLIYEENNTITRFIHSIMAKIESSNSDFLMTVLYSDEKNKAVEELGMFANEIIQISKF
jgi:KaiC/GvpD/RAD55 family RecA-like ATPase